MVSVNVIEAEDGKKLLGYRVRGKWNDRFVYVHKSVDGTGFYWDHEQELVGLGREAAKALDHLPLFCTFCGGLPGAGRVLRPHMHCNFCDPIVGYRCGDPNCDCAK